MNASYFVLVTMVLTFATGFFVASIIWIIKLLLTSNDERTFSLSGYLLHIFSSQGFGASYNNSLSGDLVNKERYGYYHGNSVKKSEVANNELLVNKELYQYNHGKN